jgi:hypothetical protein
MGTIASSAAGQQVPRDHYQDLLRAFRERFDRTVTLSDRLFTTDCWNLYEHYLNALPAEERQHHDCHACRQFVERFGGLVMIDQKGHTTPVMWSEIPERLLYYRHVHAHMRHVVGRANVTGVFLTGSPRWGTPVTGEWTHLHVTPPGRLLYRAGRLKNAGQAMAEKREEYGMLVRGLEDFPAPLVDKALALLRSETVYRAEKHLEVAKWLAGVHAARKGLRGKQRDNVTWLAVAGAPPGFCHVRSTMIGTLLEDLAARKPIDVVRRAFETKMDPLQYQRPQAAPKAGNIARAEKVVAELESAGALDRRYARLSDVPLRRALLWTAGTPGTRKAGVFGHLTGKGSGRPIEIGAGNPAPMTWSKFERTVLGEGPRAQKIEVLVKSRDHFIALATAANPDAPPILQWDDEKRRNPFSWYVYSGGSPAHQWSLKGDAYAELTAIAPLPPMWYEPERFKHQGRGVILVVEGCRDIQTPGLGLFPEILRGEYREIRSTIEAHSKSQKMKGGRSANACGIDLRAGATWNCRVRVTTADATTHYILDRWD